MWLKFFEILQIFCESSIKKDPILPDKKFLLVTLSRFIFRKTKLDYEGENEGA